MKEYYLDTAATTYVYTDVVNVIAKTMRDIYGNPSSIHAKGIQANEIVEKARKTIADYINCEPEEIVFTSGACEANSLAILGYIRNQNHSYISPFITSSIEHKSIISMLDNFYELSDVKRVSVDEDGLVNIEELEDILDIYKLINSKNKPLVSIQGANSEIGTIQDIKKISEIVYKYDGVFHCDATQLFPYKRIDVKELGIDMLSMSGQKIHAPKGIGFLYVKKGIKLEPLIYGSQEKGIRGGTENVPYIAGLAKAIEFLNVKLSSNKRAPEIFHVKNYMEHQLKKKISNCMVNNDWSCCLPNLINISFKGINAETLIMLLDLEGIYISAGSACNSGDLSPSYVLQAIGVPDDYIMGTIRITLPDDFTFDEVNYIIDRISYHVENLRMFGEK